jgi:DNA-binding MarR family transcriptional regulator
MNLPLNQVRGFAELGRALGRLTAFRDTLNAAGVTPLEYHAMLLVKTAPGERITLGNLARRLNLQRSFCTRLAEKLVENAFAVRGPSPGVPDAVLRLSPHGEKILAAFAPRHLEELRSVEQMLFATAPPPPPCET